MEANIPMVVCCFSHSRKLLFFFVWPGSTNGYLSKVNFHYIRRCTNTLVNDEKKILNEKAIKLLCNPRKGLHSLKLPSLWTHLCIKFSRKSWHSRSKFEVKPYCHVVWSSRGPVGMGFVCLPWEGVVKNLLLCPTNFCFWSGAILVLLVRSVAVG